LRGEDPAALSPGNQGERRPFLEGEKELPVTPEERRKKKERMKEIYRGFLFLLHFRMGRIHSERSRTAASPLVNEVKGGDEVSHLFRNTLLLRKKKPKNAGQRKRRSINSLVRGKKGGGGETSTRLF